MSVEINSDEVVKFGGRNDSDFLASVAKEYADLRHREWRGRKPGKETLLGRVPNETEMVRLAVRNILAAEHSITHPASIQKELPIHRGYKGRVPRQRVGMQKVSGG